MEKFRDAMADVIRMPLLSDTMTEGKIAVWNKKIGDKVKSDDSLADVETDKATMEVIPYVDGTLLYIGVEAGKAAKVNDIIAIIGKEGEDISALINSNPEVAVGTNPTEQSLNSKSPIENLGIDSQASNLESFLSGQAIGHRTPNAELPKDLTIIRMPLLSDTMTEGKIVVWNKNVGDKVKADDSLADVETDKATMEVIGYTEGTLLYKGIEAGQAAKVNEVIAVIGKKGTDMSPYIELLKSNHENTENNATHLNKAQEQERVKAESSMPSITSISNGNTSNDSRLKASPLAKSIAKQKGIDLLNVQGSGDNGRIIKRDLDHVSVSSPKTVSPQPNAVNVFSSGTEGHTDTPLTQMRKIIAQRLSESKFSAPHFYLKTSVQMDNLMNARKQINTMSPVKISVNDMMIKAVALSLAKHPEVNSSWHGDFIRQHHHIHIGSAIALPEGLIVPVIKFANQKSLAQIAADANELYDKARNKKIQPSEFTGNTFTISNLGMMDIDEFTAIINPPDACILAVGKITQTPIVEDNNIVVRGIMKLTLSCDHRAVDGAVGANFLQTLKSYLENPIAMVI